MRNIKRESTKVLKIREEIQKDVQNKSHATANMMYQILRLKLLYQLVLHFLSHLAIENVR